MREKDNDDKWKIQDGSRNQIVEMSCRCGHIWKSRARMSYGSLTAEIEDCPACFIETGGEID